VTAPRKTEARLDWFLDNDPAGEGMCAQHSWHALGGDYGNPPAWGCANANEVYAKVKASGRWWPTPPPRGALILWKYGANGHAALSMGDGRIATTDPTNDPGGSGVEPIDYPSRWGAGSYIWTDQYNGVRFDVEEDDMALDDDDAKIIWKSDILESPNGKDSTNPTWTASSYWKETYLLLREVRDLLKGKG